MKFWWDNCNKWLYIGNKEGQANNFIIQLHNYFDWFTKSDFKEWCLFKVQWDKGSFWGAYIEDKEPQVLTKMNGNQIERIEYKIKAGDVPCYFEIVVLGIGFRYTYERHVVIASKDFQGNEIYKRGE